MAGRQPNVGRRDRIARAILTPIVLALAVWLYTTLPTESLVLAAIGGLALLAFILGTGALTATCGIYAALGINTCKTCEADYAGGNTWG